MQRVGCRRRSNSRVSLRCRQVGVGNDGTAGARAGGVAVLILRRNLHRHLATVGLPGDIGDLAGQDRCGAGRLMRGGPGIFQRDRQSGAIFEEDLHFPADVDRFCVLRQQAERAGGLNGGEGAKRMAVHEKNKIGLKAREYVFRRGMVIGEGTEIIDLFYSTSGDSGTYKQGNCTENENWTEFASGVANTGTYTWDLSSMGITDSLRLKIMTTNGKSCDINGHYVTVTDSSQSNRMNNRRRHVSLRDR